MKLVNRVQARAAQSLMPIINSWANNRWYNQPFTEEPIQSRNTYIELSQVARSQENPEVLEFEKETGFKIDDAWLDQLALQTQVVVKNSPLNYAHGRVLYSALRQYLNRQGEKFNKISIIETGTARGFSSLCMAKALQDNQTAGTIVTFDVLPHREKMYWNCIADHEKGPLTRQELLQLWSDLVEVYIVFHQGYSRIELPKVALQRVNFAFLDGAHTFDDVMFEFKAIKDSQIAGDMIVFDDYDIHSYPGIVKAVDEICNKFNYDKRIIRSFNERSYVVAKKIG